MRVAHLLAESGVAGDLWLGALVDAGAPIADLQAAVDSLDLGPIRLEARPVRVRGLAASRVDVRLPADARPVRTLADAEAALTRAGLPDAVRTPALSAYRLLAEAEARVHGERVDAVTFHELGSPDTMVDIVAACAGVHALGLARLTCGAVGVGAGCVVTSHGRLPVPAPAVTVLLRGFVVHGGGQPGELATPTGAALVSALATPADELPPLRLERHGYGAGDLERAEPSLLGLLVGQAADELAAELAVILEATVDDLSPELVPVVLDRLRQAGAHDAWATPVLMKKGRPGYTLTALAGESDLPGLRGLLFRESTTFGVRWHRVSRQALTRRVERVAIGGRPVRIKLGELDGEVIHAAPEFADVLAAAAELDRPVRAVHDEAAALACRYLSR